MTNKEIDRVIFRIERKTLLRSVLATQFNGFAFVAVVALALLAFVLGESFTALLLLIVPVFISILSVEIAIRNHYVNRRMKFWDYVREYGLYDEGPTGSTKLLIDKIIAIQIATPGNELLPMRQAIKLVTAYERQARRLETINARLAELGATRETLKEKICQLQALGENHSSGLRNLEQSRAGFQSLQKVAGEIQSSCDRLEAIVNTVRKTAKARQLHHELDQMSALDAPSSQAIEADFDAESLEEIERQIGREIETYLQLERETDEHLR